MSVSTAVSMETLLAPTSASIAGAIDAAATETLPAGYPAPRGATRVPPVLLKAIAWVESSWRQFDASGRPLTSRGGGVGIMQLTRGLGGEAADPVARSAIAANYVYNIASGARLLAAKWAATPRVGDGDPRALEDWYYAVWAYSDWGWRNNPRNPVYTRVDTPATRPETFPYQERVFYYIGHPPRDARGAPLWPAVAVTLPDPTAIGRRPSTLPAPVVHHDLPVADAPLALPTTDAAALAPLLAPLSSGSGGASPNVTTPSTRTTMSPLTTTVAPSAPISQEWRLRNTGGLFWSGYVWRYTPDAPSVEGPAPITPAPVAVPVVPPLAEALLRDDTVAPARPGTYSGSWRLVDPAGRPVGPPARVALVVTTATTATPVDASIPAARASATPSHAGAGDAGPVNNAGFAGDVSIPDGTTVAPGKSFTKTWRVKNTGTTTWDNHYHWQFEAGSPLGLVRAIAVTAPVRPRQATEFSASFVAPTRPGVYQGYWQMTDASGNVFGTQSWVRIRVARSTPTATSAPTDTPTSAPTATPPTATSAPSPTPAPTATPRPTAIAWFGPAPAHAFLSEGYTSLGYQEYLSLLNPRGRAIHAQVTFYRIDGALRRVGVRLAPYARQTLDVNKLAPKESTSVRVDADGGVVAERSLYHGNSSIVSGVPLPGRRWYVPEGDVGSLFADELRVFNPYDRTAAVTLTAYRGDGTSRVSRRTVPGETRLNVSLDDAAPVGPASFTVDSSEPVVVESVLRQRRASGPSAAMALASPSALWYFPDGGTTDGNQEYISIFNPNNVPVGVHLHPVTADGYLPRATLRVGAHARAVFVVHGLLHRAGMATVLGADRPVVAQEVRYTTGGGVALIDGAPAPSRTWGFADGYAGLDFKEWITLLNPGDRVATVTVRLIGRRGIARTVTLREGPRHRDYLFVNSLVPRGPVAAVVSANHPIVAGRTLIFNKGKGLSTTVGVSVP